MTNKDKVEIEIKAEIVNIECAITVNLNVNDKIHGWTTKLNASRSFDNLEDAIKFFEEVKKCL